jgi:hypothetical protein
MRPVQNLSAREKPSHDVALGTPTRFDPRDEGSLRFRFSS